MAKDGHQMKDDAKALDSLARSLESLARMLGDLAERMVEFDRIQKRISKHVHVVSTDLLVQARLIGHILHNALDMDEADIRKLVAESRRRVEEDKKAVMLERWYRQSPPHE